MPPVFGKNESLKCKNCGAGCPGYIVTVTQAGAKVSFPEECWHCGCCRVACPAGAVTFVFPLHTRL